MGGLWRRAVWRNRNVNALMPHETKVWNALMPDELPDWSRVDGNADE